MKKYLFIPILLILTGCYNYRDLNDLAIVSGISIGRDNNNFKVSVEVINPSLNQDDDASFLVYQSSANSIEEAIYNISLKTPKQLYLAHLNILIIEEDVAKKYMGHVLDFFARNPEVRNEFYVLVGQDKDILSITTPLMKISSLSIMNTMKTNYHYLGYTNLVTFQDLLDTYLNPYQEMAISSIKSTGNIEEGIKKDNIDNTLVNANSIISGISVFRNNSLVGYLDYNDSLVYNIITNKVDNFLIRTDMENKEYFVCEIIEEDTDIRVDIKKKIIKIKINGNSILGDIYSNYNLNDSKVIINMNKELNSYIENLVLKSLDEVLKEYKSDIYGFGDIIYNKYHYDLSRDYINEFQVKIVSNIKISQKGNLNGSVHS